MFKIKVYKLLIKNKKGLKTILKGRFLAKNSEKLVL